MAEFTTHIDIDASPEEVFDHLTTVAGLLSWMGEWAELEAVPGGVFAVNIQGTPVRGRYLEVERPRRVRVSWGMAGNDDFPPGTSWVEFRLVRQGEGTRLHLHHTGLPDSRTPTHERGWTHYLARLTGAVAGADPGPDPGFDGMRHP